MKNLNKAIIGISILIVLIVQVDLLNRIKKLERVNFRPEIHKTTTYKIYDSDTLTKETTYDTIKVSYTVYNALEGQCDSSPLITADNSKINKELLNTGKLKWIALSRDLKELYNFGDTLTIYDKKDSKFNGKWIVHDLMNKRFKMKIDFLVSDKIKYGKGFCNIIKTNN